MSLQANACGMTISGTPGTGTITFAGTATGALQSFNAGLGSSSVQVDVLFRDSTGAIKGVERNATYNGGSPGTLTRGTAETPSSAVSLVSTDTVWVAMPASTGNALESQLARGFTFIRANGTTTQTTSAGTSNKIAAALSDVVSNPFTWWDTTNKRFTPQRAGAYVITAGVQYNTGSSGLTQAMLWKNGSQDSGGSVFPSMSNPYPTVVGVVELNGSTDYCELYSYTDNALTTFPNTGSVFFKAIYLGP